MNDRVKLTAQLTERAKQLGREGSTEPEVVSVNTAIIELDSTRCDAYVRRGIYYQKQCLADKAEKDFRKVLELDPGNRIASDRLKEVLKPKAEIEVLKNKKNRQPQLQSSIASLENLPKTSDFYDSNIGWREETPLHRLG